MRILRDRWKGFINAMRGLRFYFFSETSAILVWISATAVIALGCWLGIDRVEWMMVFLSTGLVVATEILNTSIEEVLDHLHPDHHPKVGKAKDLAAGGALFASFTAIAVALVVFGPRLWDLFH